MIKTRVEWLRNLKLDTDSVSFLFPVGYMCFDFENHALDSALFFVFL